ncbi:MAG: hypothetical protein ABI718_04035 [Acidobacteriota bacterium]
MRSCYGVTSNRHRKPATSNDLSHPNQLLLRAILALGIITAASLSFAQSVRLPMERGLYDRADVVVHGIVLSSEVQLNLDQSRSIATVIQPLEILKGGLSENLILREIAGDDEEGSVLQSGSGLEFTPGREVIVFASSLPSGDFSTTDDRAGKFEVWQDAGDHRFAIAETWRTPRNPGTSIADRSGRMQRRNVPAASGVLNLESFLNYLRNAASGDPGAAEAVSNLQPVDHLSPNEDGAVETFIDNSEITISAKAAGTLTATSNPINVCDGTGLGTTTITWKYHGVSAVEIHLGSATGALFAAGGGSGSAATNKWVTNGLAFYAVDKSTRATLGVLTVAVSCNGSYVRSTSNPSQSCDGTGMVAVGVEWNFPGVSTVDIKLESSTGKLFSRGGSSGLASTGKWVNDGMAFYAVNSNTGAVLGNFVESVTSGTCSTSSYPTAQKVTSLLPRISFGRPGYLQPTAVPGLSTSIMRVSDRAVFGGSSRVYRHFYSKRQPWNSDGTRLLLAHENTAYLLDGKSFKFLQAFTPWSDPVWSSIDPDILYGVASSPGGLIEYRISTKTYRVIQSFPEWKDTSIGVGEGNISDDNRYVALVGVTSTGVDVLVYDIPNQRIVSRRAFPGPITLGRDIDWVGISPSGKYVVVCLNGTTKAHDVYDSQTMNLIRRITPGSVTHGDLGYDSSGNDVFVTQNGSNAISSIRLSDGVSRQEISATAMASNQHISCRNSKRPGYCYVSTYSDIWGVTQFLYREIFALKLDGSGTVERFSQSFAADLPVSDLQYERQSQGVPSRDGTQVLFSSDFGDGSSSAIIYDYVVGMKVP